MQSVNIELQKARRKIAEAAQSDSFRGYHDIATRELIKHGRFLQGFKRPGKPYFYWPSVLVHGRAFAAICEVFRARYVGFRGKLVMVHSGGLTLGPVLLNSLQLPEGLLLMPSTKVPEPKCETSPYHTAYAARQPLAIEASALQHRSDDPDERLAIIIDDTVEDGGTALSICDLLEDHGHRVVEIACLYTLGNVGRQRLEERDIPLFSIRSVEPTEVALEAEQVHLCAHA